MAEVFVDVSTNSAIHCPVHTILCPWHSLVVPGHSYFPLRSFVSPLDIRDRGERELLQVYLMARKV